MGDAFLLGSPHRVSVLRGVGRGGAGLHSPCRAPPPRHPGTSLPGSPSGPWPGTACRSWGQALGSPRSRVSTGPGPPLTPRAECQHGPLLPASSPTSPRPCPALCQRPGPGTHAASHLAPPASPGDTPDPSTASPSLTEAPLTPGARLSLPDPAPGHQDSPEARSGPTMRAVRAPGRGLAWRRGADAAGLSPPPWPRARLGLSPRSGRGLADGLFVILPSAAAGVSVRVTRTRRTSSLLSVLLPTWACHLRSSLSLFKSYSSLPGYQKARSWCTFCY